MASSTRAPIGNWTSLIRRSSSGHIERIAYVVPNGPFSQERTAAYLLEVAPELAPLSACVPVSALPLTPEGQIDEAALARVEVIDAALSERWEQGVRDRAPHARHVAVVTQEYVEPARPLHLSELLPEWAGRRARALSPLPVISPASAAIQEHEREQAAPALLDGGPLHIPEVAPRTLVEAFLRTAHQRGHKGILHVRADGSQVLQTYAALLEEARRVLGGLKALGLRPGDRVVLQIPELPDYFVTFWACLLGGIIPTTVAVAPSHEQKNSIVSKLLAAWELLGRPFILTSLPLVERLSGLRRFCSEPLRVRSYEQLKAHAPAEVLHSCQPGDVAFFQLTSGSTGTPKCIPELHQSIVRHIHASKWHDGKVEDDVTLNWLPMDHVAPLLTYHLKDVYLGCQQVQVPTEVILADPLRWLDLMEAHGVTHTWSPNFGYKLVVDQLEKATGRTWRLDSLRSCLNGGEQVTVSVVRDFLRLTAPFGVGQKVIHSAYGMAELATAVSIEKDFAPETCIRFLRKDSSQSRLEDAEEGSTAALSFVTCGTVIPGVQVRIVDPKNQPVNERTIGNVQVRGGVVTPGYLDNPAANREAFVGDGWFNTGDLGFVLGGRLFISGREKEMLIIRGSHLPCHELEELVSAIEGVEPTYVGACSVSDAAAGTEGLALFFVPTPAARKTLGKVISAIRARLGSHLGVDPTYLVPLAKEDFPKTTSGKIQRTQLKASLLEGHFDALLKEVDLLLENGNTLPDFFFRETWRRKAERLAEPVAQWGGVSLVLLDSEGLGEQVCQELERRGSPCVRVKAGEHFARGGPLRYEVDPTQPEHSRRLWEVLSAEGLRIARVLHLWTYAPYVGEVCEESALEQAQLRGAGSLLMLLQSLTQTERTDRRLDVLVASSHAQPVLPADTVACERATLPSIVKTAAQEMPWLRCRHVDLEPGLVSAQASALLRELQDLERDELEVAYRSGQRLVPCLRKVDPRQEPMGELPFRQGGMYLLSGGLGGIGREIAKYLLTRYQARLLLIGRKPLPQHAEAYQALEQLGGQVLYEAADVTDLQSLRQLVSRACARWQCELQGVIHLAGVVGERTLLEETPRTLWATMRAKVMGAWTLAQLLGEGPEKLFLAFSSIVTAMNPARLGAYKAANRFLECFAQHLRNKRTLDVRCLSWSSWSGTGMAQALPWTGTTRAHGFYVLSPEQALQSLLAALHRTTPKNLVIGMDGMSVESRPFLELTCHGLQRQRCYVEVGGGEVRGLLDGLDVRDRFGTRSTCELVEATSLPLRPDGTVDREALIQG